MCFTVAPKKQKQDWFCCINASKVWNDFERVLNLLQTLVPVVRIGLLHPEGGLSLLRSKVA
jgi:hypothetical protein